MQRRHDPTYFAATSLLPAAVRPAIHALYGFVRTADQIVDGPDRPATPQERRAALDAWERELERARAARTRTPCRPRWSTPGGATASRSTSCAPT